MSTALALPRRAMPAVPAHIAARIAERQAQGIAVPVLGTGRSTGINRISLKGSRFRQVIDGEIVATSQSMSLDVIIVGVEAHISRTYFDKGYNPDEATAPVCWSRDGKRPAADAPSPQCTSCALCPMNAKGSAIGAGNGKAKACSSRQRVAVMVVGDETGTTYALDVKGMSLFGKDYKKDGYLNLNNYGAGLAKQGVSPWEMVTTLTFDPGSDVPKLLFSVGDFLDEDEMVIALEKSESDEVKHMLNAVDDVGDEVADAPAPAGLPPRPTPAAAAAARQAPAQAPVQQAAPRPAPAPQAAPAAPAATRVAPAAPARQAPAQAAPAPRTRVGRAAQTAPVPAVQAAPAAGMDDLEAATAAGVQAVATRPRLGGGGAAPAAQAAPAPRTRLTGGVRTVPAPTSMEDVDANLTDALGDLANG